MDQSQNEIRCCRPLPSSLAAGGGVEELDLSNNNLVRCATMLKYGLYLLSILVQIWHAALHMLLVDLDASHEVMLCIEARCSPYGHCLLHDLQQAASTAQDPAMQPAVQ